MSAATLAAFYRGYIDVLNRQAWDELHRFVAGDVEHNGRPLGLAGYRAMLVKNYEDIPDLKFDIGLLACDPQLIAARLDFRCSPRGVFLGLDVNGRTVAFAEHVFYELRGERIARVRSLIDRAAIEAQLGV